MQTPLFIPLNQCYFDAFKNRQKEYEYRREGARWNANVCNPGRTVILSCGYAKTHRLRGHIVSYRTMKRADIPMTIPLPFKGGPTQKIAVIRIHVDH